MGKVRQKKYFDCIYDGDDLVEQVLRGISSYDEAGNLVESQGISPDGEVIHIERHVYANGKTIESVQEDLVNEAVQKSTYVYDGDRILTQRDYFTDEDYIESTYTYDAEGRLTEIRKLDNEGEPQGLLTFEYNGDRILEKEYDEDGQLVIIQDYVEDAHGNKTETIFTRIVGKDEIVTEEEVRYQTKDAFAELRRYRGEDLILEIINTFDDQNRVIGSETQDILNQRAHSRSFTYNEHGKLEREEFTDASGAVRVVEMQYDAHGELIEETTFQKVDDDYFHTSTLRYEVEYYQEPTSLL